MTGRKWLGKEARAVRAVRKIVKLFSGRDPWWRREGLSPFWVAVTITVSPRTTAKLEREAVKRLMERFPGGAKEIAEAPLEDLEDAIRVSGMYRSKARAVKALAEWELEGPGVASLADADLEEARETLKSLPGIGDKVADVILMALGHPILPVDVHIGRVAKRLGLVPENAGYAEIREALEDIFRPEERMTAHFALIEFGRRVCKARPLCDRCPVAESCPSRRSRVQSR
ncbi:MAG: endonuclease III [Candidatus Korarchaeota archaeon]|nr:endonuclease III [Candidatus Korarchaeota archaeon]